MLPRVVHFVRALRLTAWFLFLLVFVPLGYAHGMYLGTALLGALALLVDVTEVHAILPRSMPGTARKAVLASLLAFHGALVAASAYRLAFPRHGAWTRVGEAQALARADEGPFVALVRAMPFVVEAGGLGAPVPGVEHAVRLLGASARRVWMVDVEGRAAFGYDGQTTTRVPLREGFVRRGRNGATYGFVGAAVDDALLLARGGALARVAFDGSETTVARIGRIGGVAADGARVVVAGDRLLVSTDAGRTFADRGPLNLLAPSAFAGGGRFFVLQGGFLSTRAFVVGEDGLEPVELPVRDGRAIVVDPQDGRRLAVASFGEGIFASDDGGATWTDLELEGLEIHGLVLEPGGRDVWAATENAGMDNALRRLRR